MIDLHAHILPALDDGPRSMGESVALCRALVEGGVVCAVATPHMFDGVFDVPPEAVYGAVRALAARLAAEGVPLRVLPGADVRADVRVLDAARAGTLVWLGEDRGSFAQYCTRSTWGWAGALPSHPQDLPRSGRQHGHKKGDTPKGVVHAVWHRRGARVASQRCPILRGGMEEYTDHAGGGKAQNPGVWGGAPGVPENVPGPFFRYVLLELPGDLVPPGFDWFLFELGRAGYTAVLTHPERCGAVQADLAVLEDLVDGGVLVQVSASGLTGDFGRRVRGAARRMLRRGLVHCLASDCHDLRRRPPRLAEAVAEAARIVGPEAAGALVEANPAAILAGEPLPCGEPAAAVPFA